MEEYGIPGLALVSLAGFTAWLVRYLISAFTQREERLTAALAESRKQFIDHLEKGSQEQVDANLAIATQLSKLNEAATAHDDQAQRRHDASMKVMQEMSTQLSWYRQKHEAGQ